MGREMESLPPFVGVSSHTESRDHSLWIEGVKVVEFPRVRS